MKKSFFIAAMLLMSISALQAQRDTLGYNVATPWYFKNYPIEDMHDTAHNGVSCTPGGDYLAYAGENSIYSFVDYTSYYSGDIAFGFYPDSTIHVIGVAWINGGTLMIDFNGDESSETEAIINHTNPRYDSIFCRLYIPYGNHMQLVREKGLDAIDKNKCRFFDVTKNLPVDDLSSFHQFPGNVIRHIIEVYFDNEIDISDSFYISTKYRRVNNGGLYMDRATGYFELHNPEDNTPFIYPPLSYRRLSDSATIDDQWQYGVKKTYPLLFPIIRRDCDTCPQVQGIQVIPSGNGQAFLKWQRGSSHVDWQVSYGPAGTAPENGTKVDCTAPQSSLIAFNPDSHYVAYVRARCRFARYEWGPWSDSVSIYLGAGGIDEARLSGMIALSPNPATQAVTIDSPLPTTLVEAYDEKGALMTSVNTSTLDVSQWPTGVYTLRIHTPQGTAVKKLVVR